MEINYKELLIKYMARILDAEGIAYIDNAYGTSGDVDFSRDEIAELEKIRDEAEKYFDL